MIFDLTFNANPINRRKKIKKIINKSLVLDQINNLDHLYQYITHSAYLPIKDNALNTVLYDGNKNSNIMVIGEAPGADEDKHGKPFVGKSGKLLENTFLKCGFQRSDLYITNLIFWRPPENRPPTDSEIKYILPILEKHLHIKKPSVIFAVGNSCLKAFIELNKIYSSITGSMTNISNTRGKILYYHNIPLIFSFHPSYVLRCPNQQDKLIHDINLINNITKTKRA